MSSTLARTVFVRPRDGRHLITPVHTLSLVHQLTQRFGPVSSFHFPRDPLGQRLLGYGSITFASKDSLSSALGSHTFVLPALLPSRPPRTYLSSEAHGQLVGHGSLATCRSPESDRWSVGGLKNPASLKAGWEDVAPALGLGKPSEHTWDFDEEHPDQDFRFDMDEKKIEFKIERRVSQVRNRKVKPEWEVRKKPPSEEELRAALDRWGGFTGELKGSTARKSKSPSSPAANRHTHDPSNFRSYSTGARPLPSRAFSTSSIDHDAAKAARKAEYHRNRKTNFIDSLHIRVVAGKGGDGCVSFHREKYVEYGPPSGGNGGQGGSIYVRAVAGPTNLSRMSRRYRAPDGQHGQGSFLHGRKAEDKIVEVPVGTVVTALRKLEDEDEWAIREYETDLLKRAKKGGWDMKGLVAKEDVVQEAEEKERKRLEDRRTEPKEEDEEEPYIDGESLLEPEDLMHLTYLRDKVWRHFPKSEDSNYRREEFRNAEMRLAFDRKRNRGVSERSAASQAPTEDDEVTWTIDLDEPTHPDSPGVLLATGGAGGLGNPTFLSSFNRSPKFATRGTPGESVELLLELKQPSDIGLVGLPNAGKSTILRALSGARAEVGHWQFTTLSPNLGVVRLSSDGAIIGTGTGEVTEGFGTLKGFDERTIEPESEEGFRLTLSDVPGLIQGASSNRGLGHNFLRHVERCSILVYVIDFNAPTPWKDFEDLKKELEEFREGLSARAKLVVANKVDLLDSAEGKEKLKKLRESTNGLRVLPVSARFRQGTEGLARELARILQEAKEEKWADE